MKKKGLLNIDQICGDDGAQLCNVKIYEVPVRNIRIPSQFTKEWVDIIKGVPPDTLQRVLKRRWKKYQECVKKDLEAETFNSKPPAGRARSTPAEVVGHIFREFSLPITIRNCTRRKDQRTSLVRDGLFDANRLIMPVHNYREEPDLMEVVGSLIPQMVPALLKNYPSKQTVPTATAPLVENTAALACQSTPTGSTTPIRLNDAHLQAINRAIVEQSRLHPAGLHTEVGRVAPCVNVTMNVNLNIVNSVNILNNGANSVNSTVNVLNNLNNDVNNCRVSQC